MDRAVAEIVTALREAGELEDTVIAFTSDNGFLYGEHRYQGKTLAYEESLRVPLLMRGPGIAPGSVRTRTTAMIDLAPTFADLAGAEPLVPVDGESMVDLATGAGSGEDRTLLVQAGIRGPDRRGSAGTTAACAPTATRSSTGCRPGSRSSTTGRATPTS